MKQYEFSGGKVRRGEQSIYVERYPDSTIYNHLKNNFDLISITAPRQCGKTSMAYGIGEQLAGENFKFVFIDFRIFSTPRIETSLGYEGEWFFQSMFKLITRQLKIADEELKLWLKQYAVKKISMTDQFFCFFKDFIRKIVRKPLVIVFDEIDRFGEWGYYTDDFFNGVQIIYDERNNLQISFILSGIAHPGLLLKGLITSSFKVGLHFPLPDFEKKTDTLDQWTQGLKITDKKIRLEVGKEILTQTGGQPYLTAYLMHKFNEADGKEISDIVPFIDEIVNNTMNPGFGGLYLHFKAPRDFVVDRERYAFAVLEEYGKILKAPIDINAIDEKVLAVLNTTGLTKLVGNHFLEVRSPIYRRIFNEEWIKKTLTGFGKRDWHATSMGIPSYSLPKKPVICLLNTGGTIGMVEHGNKMVPPQNVKEFFAIYPRLRDIADIDLVQFKAKDASNIFPPDWTDIAKAIYRRRNDGYNGFVIAHGTDTMTYTASAVAFALGRGLDIPVVFVGAQTPHYVPHGDAFVNLYRACIIASKRIPEVVISFGDEVYRAVRAEKYNDYDFQGFHSPTFNPLATITEIIEIREDELLIDETRKMECNAEFEDKVLQIGQYPGFDPDWLNAILDSKAINGIIVESLGVGNLPTFSDSKYNLLPVIEKAIKEYKIPVIITSKYPIKPEFMSKYFPASVPLQKGAISAGNMTGSAALTKLMWLLPQIEKDIKNGDLKEQHKLEEIKKLMAFPYVGEVDQMNIVD